MEQLVDYLNSISESEYNDYLNSAKDYLFSQSFEDNFSVNAYIKSICDLILE